MMVWPLSFSLQLSAMAQPCTHLDVLVRVRVPLARKLSSVLACVTPISVCKAPS